MALALPEPKPRVEIIPPSEQIRVVCKKHPFLFGASEHFFFSRMSLAQICDCLVDEKWQHFANIKIGEERIDPEYWHVVYPKPGHTVTICTTPLGGGGRGNKSGIASYIIGLTLIAASVFLGPGTLIGLPLLSAQAAGFLATAGFSMIGSGILQTVAGLLMPKPSLGDLSGTGSQESSPNLFIKGARNQARPFEPIPRLYGEHRILPAYGAQPYTETRGDDQDLYMLMCLGYGPLAIWDLKIGSTPIDEFQDVEYQIRNGFPRDPAITLFPDSVLTTALSVAITDSYQTRTTEGKVNRIGMDVDFPQGLFSQDNSANGIGWAEVELQIQYSVAGAGVWTTLDADDVYPERDNFFWRRIDTNPFARGWSWEVPFNAYDVRVKRTEAEDPADKKFDHVVWSALKSIRNEDPVNVKRLLNNAYVPSSGNPRRLSTGGLALIALRIRANDQLNGVIDTFNCMAKSIVPDYGSWCLEFDGTDSLNAGENPTITGDDPRTYECWALANDGGLFQAGADDGAVDDFSLVLTDAGAEEWTIKIGTGNDIDVVLTGSVGSWHHYALVYDGANVILYFDGVEMVNDAVALGTDAHDLRIGKWESTFFEGKIREFRTYNQARTEAQINEFMDAFGRDTPLGGLRNYWRMSENDGDVVYNYGDGTKEDEFGRTVLNHLEISGSGIEWAADNFPHNAWEPRPTQNPASHFKDMLQGAHNTRPLADTRLDLAGLQTWHANNMVEGMERRFNFVFDFDTNKYDALQTIATSARASVNNINGLWGVVEDTSGKAVKQKITPRNSWGFRGTKIFNKPPHALRARFINEDADYGSGEVIVYDDGYSPTNATRFESIEVKGITDKDEVKRYARNLIAQSRLRPEGFEVNMDFEHLVCTRGDLVELTHDVALIGLVSGRIKSWTASGSNKLTITLDEKVVMVAGTTYAVEIRLVDGTYDNAAVDTVAGETDTLTFSTPHPIALGALASGRSTTQELVTFGETDRISLDCLINNIEPQADLAARLTLIPYGQPAINDAETGEIPEYDPIITHPPEYVRIVPDVVIRSIVTDESALVRMPDGSFSPRIVINYRFRNQTGPNIIKPDYIHVQYKPRDAEDWINVGPERLDKSTISIGNVSMGVNYIARLRGISELGNVSNWTETGNIYVIGTQTPPPDVDWFNVSELPNGSQLYSWGLLNGLPIDFAGVLIRAREGTGHTWDDLYPMHDNPLLNAPWETARPIKNGTYTFGIKAVDVAGNVSENALLIEVELEVWPVGLIWQESPKAMRWPGTKTACFENGNLDYAGVGELEATGTLTWATTPADWDSWTDWPDGLSGTMVYEHTVIDVGSIVTMFPEVWQSSESGGVLVEERHSDDNITYTSYATLTPGASFSARYVQIRVTLTNTGTFTALKDMAIWISL